MEGQDNTSPNPNSQGCGSHSHISVQISPTTGGDFQVTIDPHTTVENLKKLVSKKLKVSKERICLLYRDKQLQDGRVHHHGIADGSKITLLPNVETGLVTQRPEVGIIQALESLNDTQVNEFLNGKAPLNLSMRLGDHIMLIQLQLSTVSGSRSSSSTSGTASNSTKPPSLLQASRNLQHTLQRLSSDVFTSREEDRKGSVYSGTFSGALNPALQDPKGYPRRDVATIVHILNDLLCAAPDLRRVHQKNPEESTPAAQQNTTSASNSSSNNSSNSSSSSSSTFSSLDEDQDLRTRGKLEHLRLVMDERRERRKKRKQKPYPLPQSDTDTVTA